MGYSGMTASVEGNLTGDPKKISGDSAKSSCVVVRIAINYVNGKDEEGAIYMDVKTFGQTADNVYESFKKGQRIMASGLVEGDVYNDETKLVMNAASFGASSRWNTLEFGEAADSPTGGKGRGKSSRDDDEDGDEDEKPRARRRSRDDDDDEDDRPARSSRRSRDDDDDEDDKPRRSSRRRSRDDD